MSKPRTKLKFRKHGNGYVVEDNEDLKKLIGENRTEHQRRVDRNVGTKGTQYGKNK